MYIGTFNEVCLARLRIGYMDSISDLDYNKYIMLIGFIINKKLIFRKLYKFIVLSYKYGTSIIIIADRLGSTAMVPIANG